MSFDEAIIENERLNSSVDSLVETNRRYTLRIIELEAEVKRLHEEQVLQHR